MKIRKPSVVVQIVTHNNAQTIVSCIQSLRVQRYKNFELIVIDNASTDATLALLSSLKIPVIKNRKNIGYGAAHNIGFTKKDSRYVLTLNPDIVLDRNFLGNLVFAMEHAPKSVGSAQPLLYRVNSIHEKSDRIDSAGLYLTPYRRQKLRNEGQQVVASVPRSPIFGPDGAAAFYRRTMLADINLGDGIFDESFFMHKEDVDICWRAQLMGWTSVFVPEAKAYHIRTFRAGQRHRVNTLLQKMAVRNRYYLLVKNEIPLLFFRDLFWILMYEIGMFVYMVFSERSSLDAYGMVMRELAVLFQKRRRIQSHRRARVNEIAPWFRWRPV